MDRIKQKNNMGLLSSCLLVLFLWINTSAQATALTKSACYIIYDAGSSGTRLFVYQLQGGHFIEHAGPKVAALADPIRGIRNKTQQNIDEITTEVISALDKMTVNNAGFDWSIKCNVKSVSVLATAGMRIAEQENPELSQQLWQQLTQKLTLKFPDRKTKVITQTLTGFQEGLYAWLAAKDQTKADNNFGIVEMGGASAQVAFHCPECDITNNAVKKIRLNNDILSIYSYSFLGSGQDEAAIYYGMPTSCSYGIGLVQPEWNIKDCRDQINIVDNLGLRDPYNYNKNQRGTHNQLPEEIKQVKNWQLTGAFFYSKPEDIKTCCEQKGQCFEPATSCYRPIYQSKYLQALNVPINSSKLDVSWTYGAAICQQQNCLQDSGEKLCRWRENGCLTSQ